MDMCKLGEISLERSKIGLEVKLGYYGVLIGSHKMPCRFAQRMTLSDLEWPFYASRAISAVAELVVGYGPTPYGSIRYKPALGL